MVFEMHDTYKETSKYYPNRRQNKTKTNKKNNRNHLQGSLDVRLTIN